ncbi:MFS transporter [Streptomyces sp. NRRL B-3229]|uniref:MFS transporter n=1 Tax=Streptomyces sp. NRRL B-3229 TaxID=1463836 RepID=UPI000690460D|nr:MFS transporter [Streptomyces sp. NRRL B-3229]
MSLANPSLASPQQSVSDLERRTIRKITWRLMPILVAAYFTAYLDRTNLGVMKGRLSAGLGLTDVAFGLAGGIFFLGYVLCEVPSNRLAHRLGPRLWIPRIMISWGVVAMATSLVHSPTQLYAARVLLGIAEAGMAPAVFLCIAQWYPARHRGRALSAFYLGIPLAMVVGNPLTGWLLDATHRLGGIDGWRWVFLIEGGAALVLAPPAILRLTGSPAQATWLSPQERDWLTTTLAEEERAKAPDAPHSFRHALTDRRVLVLSLAFLLICYGSNALTFWLPSVIENATPGMSSTKVGLVSALPFACALVSIYVIGRAAARSGARTWNVFGPLTLAAVSFALVAVFIGRPALTLVLLCVAISASLSTQAQFWTIPTGYLIGAAAAGGIALINATGNIAGFAGPYSFGWLKSADASGALPFVVMTGCLLITIALIAHVRRQIAGPAAVSGKTSAPAEPASGRLVR